MAEAAAEDRGKSSLRRGLMLAVKCALAAALVTWLAKSGRLDFHVLADVHLGGALGGVILGQILVLMVPLLRWSLLLRASKLDFSPRQIVQIGLISYFAVLILPATGGQEAVRLYYASRVKRGRGADILATLVLDRFVGLVGLCLLALGGGAMLLVRAPSPVVQKIVIFAAALLLLLGGITVFLLRSKPKMLRGLLDRSAALTSMLRSLETFRDRRGVLLAALGLSCLAHFGSCVSMYFAFLALAAPVTAIGVGAIAPLVTLTSSVPTTPLGIGVADVVADRLFGMIGALHGAEVTMLVRAVTAAACLASGLAYVVPVPESAPEVEDSSAE